MLSFYKLLAILALSLFSVFQPGNHYSILFKPAIKSGVLKDNNLAEVSGMIASIKNPGNFWVINDSGNEAKLYLIDKSGETIHWYWIDGTTNRDWEDIALGYDQESGKSWILIADIGDNYAVRKGINILEFEEPDIAISRDTIIAYESNYTFQYEDGPRDAETLLVDNNSSALYVISKREQNVRVYQSPTELVENDTMTLSFRTTLPFNNITSGDITPDRKEILLKNYNEIFYWKTEQEEDLISILKNEFELIRYTPEPQGESICWDREGNGFYTLSEKSWASEQVLYFFQRKNKESNLIIK